MQASFHIRSRSIRLIPVVILSILCGCSPSNAVAPTEATSQPVETQIQEVPIAIEPTVAVQPAETQFQAGLTVVESSVKVFRGTELQQAETVLVRPNDRIEVAQVSRSILNFPGYLEVELFRNAIVLLGDVKQESGGSTDVTLNLSRGHMFVRLNENAIARVTVETPYSTIRSLEDGTEFDVCHNEALTCVLVIKGVAEVIAQGKKEIINAGEASYIHKDQTPSPAICAPLDTFIVWEENYRASAETPALGKVVSELPQKPCLVMELPTNAHILYEDDFKDPTRGWFQGTIDNYIIGYSEPAEYYGVQIQSPQDKYSVFVPNKPTYKDVNIDLVVFTETPDNGDFHYGLAFRRSGNQYYAFSISPHTKKWYVLKNSSDALKVLKEGTDENIQDAVNLNALRVAATGSTFSFYINGQPVGEVSDPDYISGEVGLYVQTVDNPDALIQFDSITIWDTQAPAVNPTQLAKEKLCFNGADDDGDGLIDRADPDCEKPGRTQTPEPPTEPPTDPPYP